MLSPHPHAVYIEGQAWPGDLPRGSYGLAWLPRGTLVAFINASSPPDQRSAFETLAATVDQAVRIDIRTKGPFVNINASGTTWAVGVVFGWSDKKDSGMSGGVLDPLVLPGNRLAWRLAVVDNGTIIRLRTYTTGPNVTQRLLGLRDAWLEQGPRPSEEIISALNGVSGLPDMHDLVSARLRPDDRDFNADIWQQD